VDFELPPLDFERLLDPEDFELDDFDLEDLEFDFDFALVAIFSFASRPLVADLLAHLADL
jgi:hypothetical protein